MFSFVGTIDQIHFSDKERENCYNQIAKWVVKLTNSLGGRECTLKKEDKKGLREIREILNQSEYYQSLWRYIVGGTPRVKVNQEDVDWVISHLTSEDKAKLAKNIEEKCIPCGWLEKDEFNSIVTKLKKYATYRVERKLKFVCKYDPCFALEDFVNQALMKGITALKLKEPTENPVWCLNFAKKTIHNEIETMRNKQNMQKRKRLTDGNAIDREFKQVVLSFEEIQNHIFENTEDFSKGESEGGANLDTEALLKNIKKHLGIKYEEFARCVLGVHPSFDASVKEWYRVEPSELNTGRLTSYARRWACLSSKEVKGTFATYIQNIREMHTTSFFV